MLLPSLVVLILGCGSRLENGPLPASTAASLKTQAELGPVRVVVELAPQSPRLSDEPTLTLTIEAEEGVEVKLPPFGDSFGGFVIRDFHEPRVEWKDKRRVLRQIYRLEPVAAGKQVILPIPVQFKDARADGDGKEHTLETEALTVEVTSSVGDETPSLADLRPLKGPKTLPGEPLSRLLLWGVGLGAPAAILAVFFWRRLRRKPVPIEKLYTPTELSHLEMEALLEADFLGKGDIKSFYVELTLIVRRFIERTTMIRAPEQTTDEFLNAMQASHSFDAEKKRQLRAFLEAADLVKFAAYQPSAQDIEHSFETAKRFVGLQSPVEIAA